MSRRARRDDWCVTRARDAVPAECLGVIKRRIGVADGSGRSPSRRGAMPMLTVILTSLSPFLTQVFSKLLGKETPTNMDILAGFLIVLALVIVTI